MSVEYRQNCRQGQELSTGRTRVVGCSAWSDDREIVAAADGAMNKIVAYAPYTTSIAFDIDLSAYTCSCINLSDRRIWTPPIQAGSTSVVELPQFNHDMLFLAIRK